MPIFAEVVESEDKELKEVEESSKSIKENAMKTNKNNAIPTIARYFPLKLRSLPPNQLLYPLRFLMFFNLSETLALCK